MAYANWPSGYVPLESVNSTFFLFPTVKDNPGRGGGELYCFLPGCVSMESKEMGPF